jgi:hypothetical protein
MDHYATFDLGLNMKEKGEVVPKAGLKEKVIRFQSTTSFRA